MALGRNLAIKFLARFFRINCVKGPASLHLLFFRINCVKGPASLHLLLQPPVGNFVAQPHENENQGPESLAEFLRRSGIQFCFASKFF